MGPGERQPHRTDPVSTECPDKVKHVTGDSATTTLCNGHSGDRGGGGRSLFCIKLIFTLFLNRFFVQNVCVCAINRRGKSSEHYYVFSRFFGFLSFLSDV